MKVGDAFTTDALEANRSGRLTDAQRQTWGARSRSLRKSELYVALALVIIGLLVWLSPGPARYATVKPLVFLVALAIAAVLLVRALTGSDKLTEDMRGGEVRSIDGAITKRAVHSTGSRSSRTDHYFDVNSQRFEVSSRPWYEAAPDAGWVRIFYLPRSRRVVNLEVVEGPAVPEMTPASAQDLVQTMASAMHEHDEAKLAEARAMGQKMQDTLEADFEKAASRPDQLDTRPLAESIVGTWHSGVMTVTFSRDGTASATLLGGRKESGRWTIAPDGKLHADGFGRAEAADAWVSRDDQLTIVLDGKGLTFRRGA